MRNRAKYRAASRRAFFLVLASLVTVGAAAGSNAFASGIQNGDNRTQTSQRGDAESGDAVAGGQVIGISGSGNVTLIATNNAENSVAESGDTSGSNEMSNVGVGNVSTPTNGENDGEALASGSSPDGKEHPVDSLGPASFAPLGTLTEPDAPPAGGDVLGPPGPLGPASNVHVGDNDLRYLQRAGVRSGAAVAGGQIVGSSQVGNLDATVSNRAVNSEALSGETEMDNLLDSIRVGSLSEGGPDGSRGSVGQIGPFVPDKMQTSADTAPATSDRNAQVVYPADILAEVRRIDAEIASSRSATADVAGAPSPG